LTAKTKPRYGADRPDLIIVGSVGGVFSVTLGAYLYNLLLPTNPALALGLLALALVIGLASMSLAVGFAISTKVAKFRQRDRLLGLISWRGDEIVLDVGCGPGLLLIGAAKRLTTGRAIGVDIWKRRAEPSNRPEVTLENAKIEGVAERVEVKDGDVRNLTFSDATFDVVLSRAVLHHLGKKNDRERAIGEILRVLKPGGQLGLIIVDSWHLKEYLQFLAQRSVTDVKVLKPNPFVSGIVFLTTMVAKKPI